MHSVVVRQSYLTNGPPIFQVPAWHQYIHSYDIVSFLKIQVSLVLQESYLREAS